MSSVNSDQVVIFSIDGKYGDEVNDSRRQFKEGQPRSGWQHFDIAGASVCDHARGLILDVYRVEMDILTKVCGGSLWFAAWPRCAGSLTKVALQTMSRKKLRKRIVFTVSKHAAQRKSCHQDESKLHSHGPFLVLPAVIQQMHYGI